MYKHIISYAFNNIVIKNKLKSLLDGCMYLCVSYIIAQDPS